MSCMGIPIPGDSALSYMGIPIAGDGAVMYCMEIPTPGDGLWCLVWESINQMTGH